MFDNIFDCIAYACYLKDDEALSQSTSGGAFYAFAQYVINLGGVVFGAAFLKDFEVCHICAKTLEDLKKLQKSKYVQSRIGDTYVQARTFLEQGQIVLFSGTPCQIAGLKSFLGKEYENLLTVDLICHGVPSNQLLKEYIKQLEKDYGTLSEIQFRDKANGWGNVSVSYQLQTEKKVIRYYDDAYYYGFGQYYFLRPSCYECQFRKMRSGADITVGDYWGIRKEHPDFVNDNKGISCIIIKSEKGLRLFRKCRKQLVYCRSTVRQIANHNLVISTPGRRRSRKIFFDRWLNGEKDLRRIYQDIEKKGTPLKLGVIGSYSLRTVINFLCYYDPKGFKMQWHITNSGICSMVSENKTDIDVSAIHVSNDYRRQSIQNDTQKALIPKLQEVPMPYYIVIDFLEERFPLLFLKDNSIITDSEAYKEIQNQISVELERQVTMPELSVQYWEECCRYFMDLLKKWYKPEQIILNRSYLVENYGYEAPEHPFENLQEIRQINKKLKHYYDYFSANMPGIHEIDMINPEKDFCFQGNVYGCKPVYYNRKSLCQIRDKMLEIMEDKQQWN